MRSVSATVCRIVAPRLGSQNHDSDPEIEFIMQSHSVPVADILVCNLH